VCDVRVQREDRGWFCFPEVDLGLRFQPMQQAVIQAKLSAATAEEAVLTGKRYTGPEAVAAGIAHAVAAEADVVSTATSLVQARAGKGRDILRGLKHDLYDGVLAKRTDAVPR
jgi:enoyl-CoA hydratase/carnithine racemase